MTRGRGSVDTLMASRPGDLPGLYSGDSMADRTWWGGRVRSGVDTAVRERPVEAPGREHPLYDEVMGRPWFHSMDLGGGLRSPGYDDPAVRLPHMHLPDSLEGMSVLDVGAYDGYFSFEAERRGAGRVVACDRFCWTGRAGGMADGQGFLLAHRALESRVERAVLSVEEISPEVLGGSFDLVLFLGVLYHAPDPLGYLRRVASVCSGTLILETHADALDDERPVMVFYPGSTLNNDPSNLWGPNEACVLAMLEEVGFEDVVRVSTYNGNRLVFHARRKASS